MPADLIIYAIVAAGLVFWLRSVLGTRHGEERQRPVALEPMGEILEKIKESVQGGEERIVALFEKPERVKAIENKTARTGLVSILQADKSFDIDFFLDSAQDAFAMIIESFAEGDRQTLRTLLSESVYQAFETAITARESRQEKQITEIRSVRKAEIMQAELEGRKARITVRFTAEEMNVLRDSAGTVLYGNPDKTSVMRDVWVFGRDLKSRDETWLVLETRGDFDGDNDSVPNSH